MFLNINQDELYNRDNSLCIKYLCVNYVLINFSFDCFIYFYNSYEFFI